MHVDALPARPLLAEAIRALAPGGCVVASTDAGRAKYVEALANDLHVDASFVFKRRSGGTPVRPEILLRGASRRSATRLVAMRRSSGSSERKNSAVWSRSGWSAHASETVARKSSLAGRSSV